MEKLLTSKMASLTELRDPKRVLKKAGGKPVAILNRNRLEAYLVPASAVHINSFEPAEPGEVEAAMAELKVRFKPVFDYLKDK